MWRAVGPAGHVTVRPFSLNRLRLAISSRVPAAWPPHSGRQEVRAASQQVQYGSARGKCQQVREGTFRGKGKGPYKSQALQNLTKVRYGATLKSRREMVGSWPSSAKRPPSGW